MSNTSNIRPTVDADGDAMTPTPDTRRWRCPACGYRYVSPLELSANPTHRCNPNVKRIYTMTPDPEENR